MNSYIWAMIRVIELEDNSLVAQHASLFFHSVPGWDVAEYLRIKGKSVVNEGYCEKNWLSAV
jgi:hypothetical protein